LLFVRPKAPGALEDRQRLPRIACKNERYPQMLDEMGKMHCLSTTPKFDVFATTEHHFQEETP
jgi:hypothetical protein